MVAQELITLAESGATVMVTAMATDAWTAVRSRFVALLSRRGHRELFDDRLAASERRLTERSTTPEAQIEAWQLPMLEAVADGSDAAAELSRLIADTRQRLQALGISVQQTGSVKNDRSPGSVIVTGNAGNITNGRV